MGMYLLDKNENINGKIRFTKPNVHRDFKGCLVTHLGKILGLSKYLPGILGIKDGWVLRIKPLLRKNEG